MNESETRAELIDPALKMAGWGVVDGAKILRERDVCKITDGKITVGGRRGTALIADYILVYRGIKLAVVEAKKDELAVGEGVAQAKLYAKKLCLDYSYATNGKQIYEICLKTGTEQIVKKYPSPDQLWGKLYQKQNTWRTKFAAVPFEDKSGTWHLRYYQEIAIKRTLEAIIQNKKRILLNLATGTGKTAIAFQIAWKLFYARWNLSAMDDKNNYQSRRPRILFLADRNILADQALGAFGAFARDAIVRIKPQEIRKKGKVPTNGSIFFTIFQSFMSGSDENGEPLPSFGEYPADFFDLIIIDECHRGGANDESSWRDILNYFAPAVQLGLTATPKRDENIDTYNYFGEPVYSYTLKEGINDGFLTPFKIKRITTTLDDYIYTDDDEIITGDITENKLYEERDFNRKIEIKAREKKRVQIFMQQINENDKTLVFCATQEHAALVRDLINQIKNNKDLNYCVRVTANDGEIGERFLREFQDNEKMIPTILTTSQKLSTGVDARNIRNIVLMRPVNQMVEFKQIIGRGTRLFEGKEFFTIYDFVDSYQRFSDPEWDGEPVEIIISKPTPDEPKEEEEGEEKDPVICDKCEQMPCICSKKVVIKLKDGKEREIKYIQSTLFYNSDGKPISTQTFLNNLFGKLPELFKNEDELQKLWANPMTRKTLLNKLDDAGFSLPDLHNLKKLIDAENSDLFDVLMYVFNSDTKPISRHTRVANNKNKILTFLNSQQQEFIDFVLDKYIRIGFEELNQDKLPILLENKYQSLDDATKILGNNTQIKQLFVDFQQHLYQKTG